MLKYKDLLCYEPYVYFPIPVLKLNKAYIRKDNDKNIFLRKSKLKCILCVVDTVHFML